MLFLYLHLVIVVVVVAVDDVVAAAAAAAVVVVVIVVSVAVVGFVVVFIAQSALCDVGCANSGPFLPKRKKKQTNPFLSKKNKSKHIEKIS